MLRIIRYSLFLGAVLVPVSAPAATYYGRLTTGGFLSKERFAESSDGQNSNDAFTVSSRIYLRASEIGASRLQVTADLRDKNDFFEKLDRERLQLVPKNTFQARQLSVNIPNEGGRHYATLGRFPVVEAGPVNVDGIEYGFRSNEALRTSVFGGYNPERPDQTYLQFNADSQVVGVYNIYQPRATDRRYFFLANGLVNQRVSGHTDRFFWSDHFVYRWNGANSVSGLLNLDFVPATYVQFANLSWTQEWMEDRSSTLNLTAFDVIRYSREQGLLETLPPSPYREASLQLRHRLHSVITMDLGLSDGVRVNDHLKRSEIFLGPSFNQFIDRHFSARTHLGYRRNFISRDTFFQFDFGWYSQIWELNLSGEAGIRVEENLGTFHPVIADLGLAYYFSKALYGTVSLQNARDERVNIVSGFLKIGYRFGSQDVPPLRDGAPNRGRL